MRVQAARAKGIDYLAQIEQHFRRQYSDCGVWSNHDQVIRWAQGTPLSVSASSVGIEQTWRAEIVTKLHLGARDMCQRHDIPIAICDKYFKENVRVLPTNAGKAMSKYFCVGNGDGAHCTPSKSLIEALMIYREDYEALQFPLPYIRRRRN